MLITQQPASFLHAGSRRRASVIISVQYVADFQRNSIVLREFLSNIHIQRKHRIGILHPLSCIVEEQVDRGIFHVICDIRVNTQTVFCPFPARARFFLQLFWIAAGNPNIIREPLRYRPSVAQFYTRIFILIRIVIHLKTGASIDIIRIITV